MMVATWNINGIRARREALPNWIRRRLPDLLVLQEVKATEEEIPAEISGLEGYSSWWNGSTCRKGYSGTGLLVRDELAREATVELPPFDIENRTCVLHLDAFSLIGTYVPRGEGEEHYGHKLAYLREMALYVRSLLAKGRQVIVAGDMNVAHRDADVHHSQNRPGAIGLRDGERAAIDALLSAGLVDVMRQRHPEERGLFTWWPYWRQARERNLGWRIDCFYLSAGLLDKVTGDEVDTRETSSDHAPVLLALALS